MQFVRMDYHERYSFVSIVDEVGDVVAEERIEHSYPELFGRLIEAHGPVPGGLRIDDELELALMAGDSRREGGGPISGHPPRGP